jgi:hypothetical protein
VPGVDADGDGLTNIEEFIAGTNPILDTSVLAIEEITLAAGGTVELRFMAMAGKSYSVQYAEEPAPLEWRNLRTVEAPAASGIVVVGDLSPSAGRFYRLVTPAQP